jgi:lipid-binding SYLF domain-containing protein
MWFDLEDGTIAFLLVAESLMEGVFMHTIKTWFAVVTILLASHLAQADEYADAKQVFLQAGESAAFFDKSYGYALFPNIGKGGIGLGGAYGDGQVYVGGKHVGNSSMTQVTVGFQLGGQVYSQVIFFEDERAFNEFASGNFEFGAQATAVAITASAGAQASTGGGTSAGASGGEHDATTVSQGYDKGLAIFTVARGGLMYEAALGGQKYTYEKL